MFASYRRLFEAPGTVAFTVAALPARFSISMFGVSVVIMVATLRDSYALAGSVSAAGLAAIAVAGPWVGRMVDRYGQARMLVPTTLVSATAGGALAFLAGADVPVWTLFAAYVGASVSPNTGAMARARWAALYRDRPALLHSANALEQSIDELCFMLGPVVAALLCTSVAPQAGMIVSLVLYVTGSLAFAAQRRTQPKVHAVRERGRSPLRVRGVLEITVTFLFTGAVFGSMEVVTVAYTESLGRPAAAGVILGLLAGGSALAGLAFGTLRLRGTTAVRFLICVAAMALLLQPVLLADDVWTLGVLLFIAGLATAPTMITSMTLVHELVPPSRITEGMTLTNTGLLIGISAGASVGGWVVEVADAHTGYATPAIASALALLAALAGFGRALGGRRGPRSAMAGPAEPRVPADKLPAPTGSAGTGPAEIG
ncbi:MFS transporter [Actinoplanes sp. NPDC024001]|uniref:MFS transporter n=1 Tax=Actinoplanes sp. NPDC024001 TaxID=3154598 RepID=UPI0033F7BD2D